MKMHTLHDDHGLLWKRVGGREWAKPDGSGHSLAVFPAMGTGYLFAVLDDETQDGVADGHAVTRAEARRHAVMALGQHLGMNMLPDLTAETPLRDNVGVSTALRFGAMVLLAAGVGVVIGALVAVFR